MIKTVTIGLTTKGKWEMIANPDILPNTQKEHINKINVANGVDGKTKYKEIYQVNLKEYVTKKKFDHNEE